MGKNKRGNSRYPALSKGLNLKSRKDYIEPDYINGVRDKNGDLTIRPLNEREKKFLNDYYAESIITDFLHDPRLRSLLTEKQKLINNQTTTDLRLEIKKLKGNEEENIEEIRNIKKVIKLIKEQNTKMNEDEINRINDKMQEVRDEVLLYPDKEDHKKFYNENNARNNCIYNRSIMLGRMVFIDSDEFDKFSSHPANSIVYEDDYLDHEEFLIDQIEAGDYEEEELRLLEVLEEEKLLKKKN